MRVNLLGFEVNTGSYDSFIQRICMQAGNGMSSYNCIANVHMLVEARRNPFFGELVRNANLVTPDGMPLIVAFKLLHGIRQERVAGMNLLPDLLAAAEKLGLPVFVYGGQQALLHKAEKHIAVHYPKLRLAGIFSPPFRKLFPHEEVDVVQMINSSGAKLVIVALGCPKQEFWMASMKGRVNACMVGIGGALPVFVGVQKRAPRWMQKCSLEWLFRLIQEPRRLLRRYTVTNNIFLWLFFRQWCKQGFRAISTSKKQTLQTSWPIGFDSNQEQREGETLPNLK